MGILIKNGVSYSAPYTGYTKTLKEKLFAGETSVTFVDKCITNNVMVDWEVSKFGLVPTDKIEGNHSLTLVFPVQTEDVWVKATFSSTSSSPAPVIDYSLRKVYSDTTVGSTTSYTIEEDGIYLIILGGPYDGILTMTLPDSRAYIDGLINPGGNARFKAQYVIGKFYTGDEIILGINQQASWDTGYDKYIIKIDGFMPSGSAPVITSAVNSGSAIYTVPDDELYLLVCLAFNKSKQTSTSIVLSDSSYIFEEPVITDHYGLATSDLIGCVTNSKDLVFTVTGALSTEGNSAGYGIIISVPMKKL